MSTSGLGFLPAGSGAIYNDEWREQLRHYYARRGDGNYWAFNFSKAWAKFQRGVRQESEMADLVSHWMDLKGARVLVIGSYLGSEAIAYALRGAEVVGIDLDEDALNLSRKLAQQHGVSLQLFASDAAHTS